METSSEARSAELRAASNAMGQRDADARRLRKAVDLLRNSNMLNLRTVLPLIFNLRGKPYTLEDHFVFEPFFNLNMPLMTILKTGRQVSKSTSLAAQGILIANCIPFFDTLYVTPLYEMIRRFSNNYVRQFIEQSPVKRLWMNTSTENSVLQRSFVNHSKMIFSFAFLDAERTRGVSASKLAVDEVQDMDQDFIPIMMETMSASEWGITQLAGTPKTLENTIEQKWNDSSQGEWVIPCPRCHYDNVPALAWDLDQMIGPWHPDISEARPGVICAKCKRPLSPRLGRWMHNHPHLVDHFAGYHVPQLLMPMHYADSKKWNILVGKREGRGSTPLNVFYNEVCGESYDMGAKMVTVTDLKRAAILGPNTYEHAAAQLDKYVHRVLAVDWGGGGQKMTSFTSVAVLGMLPDGKIDCIYGWRSNTPHDWEAEAKQILHLLGRFRCSHLVHDYTGAGEGRHLFLSGSGYPESNIVGCAYIRAASGAIIRYIPYSDLTGNHAHWRVDKTRSLTLTCAVIKNGGLRFFDYDHKGADGQGLLHDFLALIEDKASSRTGSDLYTIIKPDKMSDDFAQAVNIGCMALYQMSGHWPNVAILSKLEAEIAALEAANPMSASMWDEMGYN